MNFTGKSLALVRTAVDLALSEVHSQRATCTDVVLYEWDLLELDKEQASLTALRDRIDATIKKEQERTRLRQNMEIERVMTEIKQELRNDKSI